MRFTVAANASGGLLAALVGLRVDLKNHGLLIRLDRGDQHLGGGAGGQHGAEDGGADRHA